MGLLKKFEYLVVSKECHRHTFETNRKDVVRTSVVSHTAGREV